MSYSETIAERIRDALVNVPNIAEKKMFGGIAFMVDRHMVVGVIEEMLLARVGPKYYEEALKQPGAHIMDFTGKPLKGLVYVDEEGIATDEQLHHWIDKSLDFVATLPPKK